MRPSPARTGRGPAGPAAGAGAGTAAATATNRPGLWVNESPPLRGGLFRLKADVMRRAVHLRRPPAPPGVPGLDARVAGGRRGRAAAGAPGDRAVFVPAEPARVREPGSRS